MFVGHHLPSPSSLMHDTDIISISSIISLSYAWYWLHLHHLLLLCMTVTPSPSPPFLMHDTDSISITSLSITSLSYAWHWLHLHHFLLVCMTLTPSPSPPALMHDTDSTSIPSHWLQCHCQLMSPHRETHSLSYLTTTHCPTLQFSGSSLSSSGVFLLSPSDSEGLRNGKIRELYCIRSIGDHDVFHCRLV